MRRITILNVNYEKKPETEIEKAILENGVGMFAICAESLQTLNTAVWQEWFPNDVQKYKANGTATLEVYSASNPQSPDYECGIWVPIQGMEKII